MGFHVVFFFVTMLKCSIFQVVVTPTRVKNARRKIAAREPTAVVLAPFSAKSVVTFDDIPVTKTARRFLNITNPSDEDLEVRILKSHCTFVYIFTFCSLLLLFR